MRINSIIATPSDNPHKWDLALDIDRGVFGTNVVDVEWYFGARQDTPLNTGKKLEVKDFTFKGDSKLVKVFVTDSKGERYSAEITLVAVEKDAEPKKSEPKTPAKKPEPVKATEPKKVEEPVKPVAKPTVEPKKTEEPTDTKVVTPEAPKAIVTEK